MRDDVIGRQVRCILATQIAFIISLVIPGIVLTSTSGYQLANYLWACPVLNIYYAVAWLSLVLGSLQSLFGVCGAVMLAIQPLCVNSKTSSVILVGPKGHIGQIEIPNAALTTTAKSSQQMWRLNLSLQQHNNRWCFSGLGWLRALGVVVIVLVIGEFVALFLAVGFESRALNSNSGIANQMIGLFLEVKNNAAIDDQSAHTAMCWNNLEQQLKCCGASGYEDWLSDAIGRKFINSTNLEFSKVIERLVKQCGCISRVYSSSCNQVTIANPIGGSISIDIFTGSCAYSVTNAVLTELKALKTILSVSCCCILVTFLTTVGVTLRIATKHSLEMEVDVKAAAPEVSPKKITASHSLQPQRISSVARPALDSFIFTRRHSIQ